MMHVEIGRECSINIAQVRLPAKFLSGRKELQSTRLLSGALLRLHLPQHFEEATGRNNIRTRHIVLHKPSSQQRDAGQFTVLKQRSSFGQSLIDLNEAGEFVTELVCGKRECRCLIQRRYASCVWCHAERRLSGKKNRRQPITDL